MRAKIKELLKEAGGMSYGDDGEELTPSLIGESVDYFTQLVINECINAIEEASKSATYTTYDKGVADTIAARSIQEIQKRFK